MTKIGEIKGGFECIACNGEVSPEFWETIAHEQDKEIKRIYRAYSKLFDQRKKVIALIKDGRFVEALQELENETLA